MATIDAVADDIRKTLHGHFNDLEYLAQLIEDTTISNTGTGNELQSRLVTIFDASSDGSEGGVTHFDKIFDGCRDRGFREGFRDASNQVGHFMTAVDMGFRPTKTASYLRSWGVHPNGEVPSRVNYSFPLPASATIQLPWEEEICVRLIIGHEQIADAAPSSIPGAQRLSQGWSNAQAVFSATYEDVLTFFEALNRVPLGNADLAVTRAALAPIHINHGAGNSMMDLQLSLYGYQFGRFIRGGRMATCRAAAAWIRWNIGGTFAFVQRT